MNKPKDKRSRRESNGYTAGGDGYRGEQYSDRWKLNFWW